MLDVVGTRAGPTVDVCCVTEAGGARILDVDGTTVEVGRWLVDVEVGPPPPPPPPLPHVKSLKH
jgi:hypothetical protein